MIERLFVFLTFALLGCSYESSYRRSGGGEVMRNDGVLDALNGLLEFDPDVADRAEVGTMIGRANQVLGWVQAANVRLARRLRELEAAGESESAAHALMA